jgi:hypothetical protein
MAMIGKLSALKVAREKRPGVYGDGGGLYLQVTKQGSKSWIFRFWVAERDPKTGAVVRDPTTNNARGRGREMGLGSCITVSLAEARDRALECRKLREKEIDRIEAREAARRGNDAAESEPIPGHLYHSAAEAGCMAASIAGDR